MECPNCGTNMKDVTETWHTFEEAEGAEYLASYVTIWHCPSCHTVVGVQDGSVEWVMQPREALPED
jgi:predicted RNA-binding Zn-ribbon protein involved in translation (DUF1610 family)